ncbi:MAG: hypothetical protein D6698_11990 [Gammaproteobacteria bacterium]|nr:MAG: hypothetical protein D6698_11990 [Gammaproteobacteria bacterium]
MVNIVQLIRRIERAAYPQVYWGLQDIESLEDVAEYVGCHVRDLVVLHGENWYLLGSSTGEDFYIADLASAGGMGLKDLAQVKELMLQHERVYMEARETTSYRLVKFMERRGLVSIMTDHPFEWGGEVFHEIELEIRRRRKV